jgi:hypothetical protein
MANESVVTNHGTDQERFERILSQPPFEGLKALLDRLSPDRSLLQAGAIVANTLEELLARLGFKLTVTRQIHVQDCYSRLSREGGIKAVLPCYDIPTQSSLPTLVNYDNTVTATPKGVAFFNALLGELKKRLSAQTNP